MINPEKLELINETIKFVLLIITVSLLIWGIEV